MDKEKQAEALLATKEAEGAKKTEQVEAIIEEGKPARLSSRKVIEEMFPDQTFNDDEEYDSFLSEHLATTSSRLKDNDKANEIIGEILEDYPELALIVEDMKMGVPLNIAIAKYLDPEDLVAQEGDEDYNDYIGAVEERRTRHKESKSRVEEREKNIVQSQGVLEEFIETAGWDDEKSKSFTSWIEQFIQDFSRGLISEEILTKLKKGFEFEEAIEEAVEEAKIEERNAKIETKREKRSSEGDGLPTGGGAVKAQTGAKIFDLQKLANG